ncbi:MAG: type II toxin-antitoxin system RelE/ParE family toxin [Bacteroidota bacterium]
MAKQIIWAPQAVADRVQILDYWYQRLGSKDYSVKIDNLFKDTIHLLSQFPELGRAVEKQNIRVFVRDHYQIFYLNDDTSIKILHIWDSRRNPDDLKL